jgi:uncharacterized membrane protein YgdD (TMEM256/DUF423 family)
LRYRILALVVLVTAVGAYFAASHDEVRADVRIVQAPPTASASPAPSTAGAKSETARTKSEAGHSSSSFAVGFTLFEGRLYLVSTSDKTEAAQPEELTAPTFVCDEKKSTDRKFEAWLLRNNGGSGTVPQFDDDGSLLTAPHTGTPLYCALREGPER